MRARILSGLVMVVLVLVAACAAKPIGFELEVKVLLDGKPVGTGKPGAMFARLHKLYQEFKRDVMRKNQD